jgi:hypothetical protein
MESKFDFGQGTRIEQRAFIKGSTTQFKDIHELIDGLTVNNLLITFTRHEVEGLLADINHASGQVLVLHWRGLFR